MDKKEIYQRIVNEELEKINAVKADAFDEFFGSLFANFIQVESLIMLPIYIIVASIIMKKYISVKNYVIGIALLIGSSIVTGSIHLFLRWSKIQRHYDMMDYPAPNFLDFLFYPVVGSFIITGICILVFIARKGKKTSNTEKDSNDDSTYFKQRNSNLQKTTHTNSKSSIEIDEKKAFNDKKPMQAKTKKEIFELITFKKYFNDEKYYKLFLVLQIFMILLVIMIDILERRWSIIYIYYDFTSGRFFWEHFIVISTIILPIFISRGIDWILTSKEES